MNVLLRWQPKLICRASALVSSCKRVKSRYGKQVLAKCCRRFDEATRKIIEDNDLRIATNPNLDVTEYEEGDLKASIKIEVMPEIGVDLAKLTLTALWLKSLTKRLMMRSK